MKIYSWNVNGIRSAWDKGLKTFLETKKPDILCLQEVKANFDQFPSELIGDLFNQPEYIISTNCANRPGYAGVTVFSKEKPNSINDILGHERFDSEGRMLELEFTDFILFNFYLPHGGRFKENLNYKLEVYDLILKKLANINDKKVILTGDFNIAHDERDLARPKQNLNNIMFTIDERRKLDKLESLGFVDTLRQFKFDNGHYTWFPYSNGAKERNLGWRIDYFFVTQNLKSNLKDAFICTDITGSDHVPVGIKIF
jgi:exodeoxyribonuclease-3